MSVELPKIRSNFIVLRCEGQKYIRTVRTVDEL